MEKPLSSDLGDRYSSLIFPGKRSDEAIILFLRRHWLVLLFKLLPLVVYFFILVAFNLFGEQLFRQVGLSGVFVPLIDSVLWMFFWIILFVIWVDYYLDVWIVSDERVINIEQLGLFRRQISELDLSKIQDITSDVQGVIPTLFNFGYVYIQTAGEKERFIFKQIPDPVKVRNMIMQLQKRAILEEKRTEGAIIRGKL